MFHCNRRQHDKTWEEREEGGQGGGGQPERLKLSSISH